MLCILRIWKKEKVQECHRNVFKSMKKSLVGDTEGKAPQGTHWERHGLLCLFWGVGGSWPGSSGLLMATGALSFSQRRQDKLWKVSFLSLFFPWRGLCQRPVMLIWPLQLLAVRSSGKLNAFDTIIPASSALCSPGEWRVTLMLLTWLTQLLWGGCQVQASGWLSMSFPNVRMGPVDAGGLPQEGCRDYLCWGLSLTHKRVPTYTHMHTHICHDEASVFSSSMILVDNQIGPKGSFFPEDVGMGSCLECDFSSPKPISSHLNICFLVCGCLAIFPTQ